MNKQEVIGYEHMQAFKAIDDAIDFGAEFKKSEKTIDGWIDDADSVSKLSTRQYETNKKTLTTMHLLSKHVAGFELDKDRAIEVLIDGDMIHLNPREFTEKATLEFGSDYSDFARRLNWTQAITQSPYYEHIKEVNANRFVDFLTESERYSKVGRGAEFYVNILLKKGIGGSQVQTVVDHYLGRESGFFSPEKNRKVATIESMYKQTMLEELPEHSPVTSFGIEFEPVAAAAFKAYYESHHDVELIDVRRDFYNDILKAGEPFRCAVDGLFRVKGSPDDAPVFVLPDYKMPHALSNGRKKADEHKGLTSPGYIKQIKIYTQAFKDALEKNGIKNAEVKSHIFQFGMNYLNELTDVVMSDGAKGEKLIEQMSKIAQKGVLTDAPFVHYKDNYVQTPDMRFEFENLYKPAGAQYEMLLSMGEPALDPKFERKVITDDVAKQASLKSGVVAELINSIERNNESLCETIKAHVKGKYSSDYGRVQYAMRKMSAGDMLAKLLEVEPDFDVSEIEDVVTREKTKLNTDLLEALGNKLDINDKLYTQTTSVSLDSRAQINAARNDIAAALAGETDALINESILADYEPEQSVTPKP